MRVKTYHGESIEVELKDGLSSGSLLALPALIDCHVHFRTPGAEHKENWASGARAALAGGVTTVFDMPNNQPPIVSAVDLDAKEKLIQQQLAAVGLPLRHYLYFGATADNWREMEKVKDRVIGVKLFMGASTGNLLVDKEEDQAKIFAEAARLNLLVAVHAEDETEIRKNQAAIVHPLVADHSRLRPREVAIKAVSRALALAKRYGTRLYLCHITTKEEVEIVRQAKAVGQEVYAEVTPHHLFLNQEAYQDLGSKAQVYPPLRTSEDQEALWEAVRQGLIDTIATDHAPHTLAEKSLPYPQSPSGVPGLETCLPLLLNAYHQGRIALEKIVHLTHDRPKEIFGLPENNDWVIVDMNLEKEVKEKNLKTKCGWSPYAGWLLRGWPVAVILRGNLGVI